MASRVLIAALLCSVALAAPAAAQSQETQIAGVTASLAYARVSNGALRVGILLKNDTDHVINFAEGIKYSDVVLVDAKSSRKYFAFKAGDGHYLAGPVSDWDSGGRWFPHLAPKSEALLWIIFNALPAGTKVTIQAPQLQPFDDVEIKEAAASPKDDPGTGVPPLHINFVSATRTSGQLRMRLKVANTGKTTATEECLLLYKDVHVFDPQSKTLYSLIKDTEGTYAAQPADDKSEGGRYFVYHLQPGAQTFLNLTFEAPPDPVRLVDVLVHCFGPIESVPLGGEELNAES